jgi:ribosomal protein S15P/S13E
MVDNMWAARHESVEVNESWHDEAEKHLSLANDADNKGDKLAYHHHMADHHDALSQWHESKGRSASADKHAEKADYHQEQMVLHANGVHESLADDFKDMLKDKGIKHRIAGSKEDEVKRTMNKLAANKASTDKHPLEPGDKYPNFGKTRGYGQGHYMGDSVEYDEDALVEDVKEAFHEDEAVTGSLPSAETVRVTGSAKKKKDIVVGEDVAHEKQIIKKINKVEKMIKGKKIEEHYDDEDHGTHMAKLQLLNLMYEAKKLHDHLEENAEADLPDWIKSKITMAQDYVAHSLEYIMSDEHEDEYEDEENEEHMHEDYADVDTNWDYVGGKKMYDPTNYTKGVNPFKKKV